MPVVFLSALCCILTFVFTGSMLSLFMIWNLCLAALPLWIQKHAFQMTGWKQGCLLVLWLLFLPNAFYMITDLLHLSNLAFTQTQGYSSIYLKEIAPWMELGNLYFVVCVSCMMGLISLDACLKHIKQLHLRYLTLGILSFLIALGIYIGRFLRFNSWDIISMNLFRKLYFSFDFFTWKFILFFGCLILILYVAYRYLHAYVVRNIKSI